MTPELEQGIYTKAQVQPIVDENKRLRKEVAMLNKCIVAHHEIHTLSDSAIKENLGIPCQICRRATQEG